MLSVSISLFTLDAGFVYHFLSVPMLYLFSLVIKLRFVSITLFPSFFSIEFSSVCSLFLELQLLFVEFLSHVAL